MERGQRLLWIAAVSSLPTAALLGMLFFQLKRIEILTQDTEAELELARQKKQHLQFEIAEDSEAAAPQPPATADPS